MGGLSGFILLDPARGEIVRHYRYDPRNRNGLRSDTVYSFYQQYGGPLWVGTAAGLGARAVGTAAPGPTTAASSGMSTSTNGSGAFGSNGRRSSSSSSQNDQPLTINLTVMPGGEAEAGRQINKALNAYYSQTGQGVPAAMVAA